MARFKLRMKPKGVYEFYLYISQGSVEIIAILVRGSECPCDNTF